MRFGLPAVHPGEVGIGRGGCFQFSLPLVLECPGRTLPRSLFTFEPGVVQTPFTHARNMLPHGG